jgi:hypothetical protein
MPKLSAGRMPPLRRVLAPAGAAVTLLVVVGVAISQSGGGTTGGGGAIEPVGVQPAAPGGGGAVVDRAGGSAAPAQGEANGLAKDAGALAQSSRAGFGAANGRKVVQKADLQLATEPDSVRDVADGIVGVVDRYHGFVVTSSVSSGTGSPGPDGGPVPLAETGQASANFELRIPVNHLQAALADLSGLAHVNSRTENIQDITRRFDESRNLVADLEAQKARLLRKLGEAVTITEQDALKARLATVEQQLGAARNDFESVQRRIHLVPVTVEVFGQEGIDGGGTWGIDDAAHDAGRALTVMGGVLLISAAILAPLGVLAAIAWFTTRAIAARRRERALDQTA